MLVQRTARRVRIQPPFTFAQSDQTAVGIAQRRQHRLIARALYDRARVGQREPGLLVITDGPIQRLEHFYPHAGLANPASERRFAPDVQRPVTQATRAIDTPGYRAHVLQRVDLITGCVRLLNVFIKQPDAAAMDQRQFLQTGELQGIRQVFQHRKSTMRAAHQRDAFVAGQYRGKHFA
ncbi:hypothetical protein ALP75_200461 [Pseudomonas syringae pv. actinidiae]|nr:hypothetical protein ALP75_200461 [Pseudomonas syringae pv. actinidiae]